MSNREGYADKTAEMAIEKVMNEQKFKSMQKKAQSDKSKKAKTPNSGRKAPV